MAKTFSTEGKFTVATDGATRWTIAPDQVEKHKLDAAFKTDLDAAPKATRDAIVATELAAGIDATKIL
jgi:hypothetical protein